MYWYIASTRLVGLKPERWQQALGSRHADAQHIGAFVDHRHGALTVLSGEVGEPVVAFGRHHCIIGGKGIGGYDSQCHDGCRYPHYYDMPCFHIPWCFNVCLLFHYLAANIRHYLISGSFWADYFRVFNSFCPLRLLFSIFLFNFLQVTREVKEEVSLSEAKKGSKGS